MNMNSRERYITRDGVSINDIFDDTLSKDEVIDILSSSFQKTYDNITIDDSEITEYDETIMTANCLTDIMDDSTLNTIKINNSEIKRGLIHYHLSEMNESQLDNVISSLKINTITENYNIYIPVNDLSEACEYKSQIISMVSTQNKIKAWAIMNDEVLDTIEVPMGYMVYYDVSNESMALIPEGAVISIS